MATSSSSGTSSISGIISGMDTASIISGLMEIERAPLRNMEARKTIESNKLIAWKSIQANLVNLKIQSMIVNRTATFDETAATSSDESIVRIDSATYADQVAQSFTVGQLARGQQSLSRGFASKTAAIMAGGQLTLSAGNDTDDNDVNNYTELSFLNNGAGVTTSGASFTLMNKSGQGATVSLEGATDIKDVIDRINDADINITASINDDGTGLKLTDTSNGGGTLAVMEAGGNAAQQLGILGSTMEDELAGADLDPLYTVTIDATNNSLEGIRDAINDLNGPFTASIINVGSSTPSYKLMIASRNTGTIGQLTFTDSASVVTDEAVGTGDGTKGAAAGDYALEYAPSQLSDVTSITVGGVAYAIKGTGLHGTTGNEVEVDTATGNLQFFVDGVATNVTGAILSTYTPADLDLDQAGGAGLTIQTAQDAQITMGSTNPITIERHSNTIDDFLNGVTFTLLKESDEAVTIEVTSDTDGIKESINAFLDAYNTLMSSIRSHGTYDAETKTKGGALFGDTTLAMIENQVQDMIISDVEGITTKFRSIFQIGVSSDLNGKLTVNDTELTAALTNDLADVVALFTAKVDVALSSLGTTATVSPGTEAGYDAQSVLNGVDTSSLWGTGSGWMGSTDLGTDYFTLNFLRARSVTRLTVNTLDSDTYPSASWGIRAMAVQYLRIGGDAANESDWITSSNITDNTAGQITTYLAGVMTTKVRLKITGTNAADSRARITQVQAYEDSGVAGSINSAIANLTDASSGLIKLAQDAVNARMEDYDDRITVLEERLAVKEARLREQYNNMEESLSSWQSTSNWLSQQIASFNNLKS